MWWYEEDFECIMKLTGIHWIPVGLFQHTIIELFHVLVVRSDIYHKREQVRVQNLDNILKIELTLDQARSNLYGIKSTTVLEILLFMVGYWNLLWLVY